MKKMTIKRLGLIVIVAVFLIGCVLFFSQPPKIPHKVTDEMDCKGCHATGINGAPVSPHPNKPNCISCHKTK